MDNSFDLTPVLFQWKRHSSMQNFYTLPWIYNPVVTESQLTPSQYLILEIGKVTPDPDDILLIGLMGVIEIKGLKELKRIRVSQKRRVIQQTNFHKSERRFSMKPPFMQKTEVFSECQRNVKCRPRREVLKKPILPHSRKARNQKPFRVLNAPENMRGFSRMGPNLN